ncbi:MBL fold metallo-hydrolase [Pedobacter aquatilis]|uniref:MBL fold metallo-hydrolase n=1 Tax=Pedobacter aquatilis TaxID=351343 RepID=UPI0025B4A6F4|nr:MBL fold metallo-hydrolase [Pedobacter aquatilis]MDN3585530.1 MBL fold metallo-hydrolase [Pedobacter aquatilis]
MLTKLSKSIILILFLSITCFAQNTTQPYVLVLGVAQDGGYPHMGCTKICCTNAWKNPETQKAVSSIALVDPKEKKWYLFDATPDIKKQLKDFSEKTKNKYPYLPDGIFITHAHIGHYTGLMEFGREVMNTKNLNVYVLPKLKSFLEANGPWSQLVKLQNIGITALAQDKPFTIGESNVIAFTVPHRDEYSETAGFEISTQTKKYLFIPDIDKWSKWNQSIIERVKKVDFAFLDATFFNAEELGNRPISEVPHPLVTETTKLFENEALNIKSKIHFIHLNHTNKLLWDKCEQKDFLKSGFNLAKQGGVY